MVDVAKKKQTVINRIKLRVGDRITDANTAFDAIIAQIQEGGNSDVLNSFTSGERNALLQLKTDLNALASSSIITNLNNRYVESHGGNAMTEPGA